MTVSKNETSNPPVSVNPQLIGPQLLAILQHAPVAMCLLSGENFIVSLANDAILEIWGKSRDVLDKPLFDGLPEAEAQGFRVILENVYTTGQTFIAHEMPLNVVVGDDEKRRFVKFIYQAYRDASGEISGIIVIADDITESVNARIELEANEIRNKLAIAAGNMASFEWVFDNSKFIYSDRLPEIFGLDPSEQFKQESFVSLLHPEDRPIRDRAVRLALQTGDLFYEARVVRPDGIVNWIRLVGKVENQDDKPAKMYGMVIDISRQREQSAELEELVRKRTESLVAKNRQLAESERRYQRMTEEVQDYAILLLSVNGTILNWNRGAEKIKGYTEDEIVGKNIRVFYLPKDRRLKLPETLIKRAADLGKAMHEGYRIRKDGSVFWGVISITALHDDDGNVIGFSKVTRDLTELKAAEDQLRNYTAELEFRNRELEQFAYIASHDLQEPLRKIRMFTGMLSSNLDKPELVERYHEKIEASAERMSELIQSVLNYSRLSREDNAFQTVDLSEIVNHVLFDFEVMIEEKNATVTCDYLPSVTAIPMQMTQLFLNLVGNALKFCNAEPKISITCSIADAKMRKGVRELDQKRDYYCICVIDNGIGFEQRYAEQIFTIFQRLNSKSDFQGTGIGLALCKKIVENHKGAIKANSKPGKGTAFSIFLPV